MFFPSPVPTTDRRLQSNRIAAAATVSFRIVSYARRFFMFGFLLLLACPPALPFLSGFPQIRRYKFQSYSCKYVSVHRHKWSKPKAGVKNLMILLKSVEDRNCLFLVGSNYSGFPGLTQFCDGLAKIGVVMTRILVENELGRGGNNIPIQNFGRSLTIGNNQSACLEHSGQIVVR